MADVRKAGPLVGTLTIRGKEDAAKLCEILAMNGFVVSAERDTKDRDGDIQLLQTYQVHIYVEGERL